MKDPNDRDRNAHGREQSGRDGRPKQGEEFSDAIGRLEQAVQELVAVTAGELSDRATTLLDETSKRLEDELRFRRTTGDEDAEELAKRDESRRARLRYRSRFGDPDEGVPSTKGQLYIDPSEEKVAGVCAAIARYFGFETWAVRLAAVSGLIFMPGVVFPAYWVSYFVMDKIDSKPKNRRDRRRGRSRSRRRIRAARKAAAAYNESYAAADEVPTRTTAPEPSREPENPKRHLRYTQTDLAQAELKLRRIESFVTSDQYELQKELAKIDSEDRNGDKGSHAG